MFRRILAFFTSTNPRAMGVTRSAKWKTTEKVHLKLEPMCVVCGTRISIAVHHVRPFHLFPELELDPDNLLTLCPVHHLWVGHLGSWQAWNASVRIDSAIQRHKIQTRATTRDE